MSEDINPLAPAEDANQEETPPETAEVSSDENAPVAGTEEATPRQIPAWAVKPDAARTGDALVEYDGARAHDQVSRAINQGT